MSGNPAFSRGLGTEFFLGAVKKCLQIANVSMENEIHLRKKEKLTQLITLKTVLRKG